MMKSCMKREGGVVPVWFFIGVLLLFYGVLITGAGLWELSNPRPSAVALRELHAPVWWGLALALLGAFYTISYRPGKSR
jgi:hypothetical protein